MDKWRNCPACKGEGRNDSDPDECTVCDGRGKVRTWQSPSHVRQPFAAGDHDRRHATKWSWAEAESDAA